MKSAEIKEKTLKERSEQIINGLAKKHIELRYDRNPKNFQPKDNNIIEKIISLQNYYHAREKVYSKSLNPQLKDNENNIIPNEKIERLENYHRLLDLEQEKVSSTDTRSAYLVVFFSFCLFTIFFLLLETKIVS